MENDTTAALDKFQTYHVAHQGPLQSSDKDWKGSTYNVLVEWETW